MRAKRRQPEPPAVEVGDGISCPECGGSTSVERTTNLRGQVRRRRKCDRCGHGFNTLETLPHNEDSAGVVARLNAIIDDYELAADNARRLRDSLLAEQSAICSAKKP